MKKPTCSIFILFTILLQNLNAQDIDLKEFVDIKWHTEYMQIGNGRYDIPKDMISESWILFKKNGICIADNLGRVDNGTWKYLKEKNDKSIL